MKVKATIETMASAVGFVALGMGLIYLASFGAILFAYFTMAPHTPGIV
jgi:hypothetical protein